MLNPEGMNPDPQHCFEHSSTKVAGKESSADRYPVGERNQWKRKTVKIMFYMRVAAKFLKV
jgi:hypothetical protein